HFTKKEYRQLLDLVFLDFGASGGLIGNAIAGSTNLNTALNSPTVNNIDLQVDIQALTGLARFVDQHGRPIPVLSPEQGPTQYHALDAPPTITQSRYDFDGDGRFEESVAGRFVEMSITNDNDEEETIEVFQEGPVDDATHQGIYLSSQGSQASRAVNPQTGLPEPDLVRLMDQQ